ERCPFTGSQLDAAGGGCLSFRRGWFFVWLFAGWRRGGGASGRGLCLVKLVGTSTGAGFCSCGLARPWAAASLCVGFWVTDEVLADQVDYYRRRAGEYDVTAYGDVAAARARIARLVAEMRPAGLGGCWRSRVGPACGPCGVPELGHQL